MPPLLHHVKKLLIILVLIKSTESLAVMSVDLGSEWLKIGVVSPGLPMETVLNRESKRKTPSAIAFHDGRRIIGEDALNIAVRFPEKTLIYFTHLIGRSYDSEEVKEYQTNFPYVKIERDEERDGVLWKIGDHSFTTEELIAMLLTECKHYTEEFTSQIVTETVIVVPPYYDQTQRKGILAAGKLAGLKVLMIVNSNLAASLNYGIFRRKDFNSTHPQHILLYDMGASSAIATVVSYSVVKEKNLEQWPELRVLGVGYSTSIGGLNLQLRLQKHLADVFRKATPNVELNGRSMAKLFKEAGRVKNVLSANGQHQAQIESLTPTHDFRTPITRQEFEDLNADILSRVHVPAQTALDTAGLTIDSIQHFILIGAGTRVPKIQENLVKYFGKELSKNLNTDEACSMGAVYKGADLSTGFKVQKFGTRDGVVRGVVVDFSRTISTDPLTVKKIRRTLFPVQNPFPQKKIMTFNKNLEDFEFFLNYLDGSGNLTKVEVKGVGEGVGKWGEGGYRGVKAHFNLDDSGLITVTSVEAIFETDQLEEEEQGTMSKVASAFSNLFGNGTKEVPEEPAAEAEAPEADAPPLAAQNSTNETGENPEPKSSQEKKKIIKEKLEFLIEDLGVKGLGEEGEKGAVERLSHLNALDKEIAQLGRARNNLEALVHEMSDKIESEEFGGIVGEEEKGVIGRECGELSDWLYTDDPSPQHSIQSYESKFKNLKKLTQKFTDRIREHKSRPDALEGLNQMLNISRNFLKSSKGLSEDQQLFTQVEIETLNKLVMETEDWVKKMTTEQNNLKLWEEPKLTVRGIGEKVDGLDREVKYMLNKARVERLKKEREAAAAASVAKEKEAEASTASTEPPPEGAEDAEIPMDSIIPTEEKETKQDIPNEPTEPHTEL